MTHEGFIQEVKRVAVERIAPGSPERKRLDKSKLVYGVGGSGYRGITYFEGWTHGKEQGETVDFMEVTARGEESPTQLAGTTLHELAHSLAGPTAGHGKDWKAACQVLGLNARREGGQDYQESDFDPGLWNAIKAVIELKDGKPNWTDRIAGGVGPMALTTFTGLGRRGGRGYKACPLGIGTRGGKSRGVGSGSRLRLYICECPTPTRVRVASDTFEAHCDICSGAFKQPVAA